MRFFGRGKKGGTGLLSRLARDRRGNTIVLATMALIPLIAMIGSGLDMARAWTVQARLQQACDSAALAGRRAMLADQVDNSVRAEVTKFFNFNFPQRMYDTAAFTPAVTRPAAGTVQVNASTTVPTALMQVFGFYRIPINVTCNASQEYMNIDIVMVLDTTGSMTSNMASGGRTRIQALRNAVMAFYRQLKPVQDELEANGYRLRYGIVPYSSNVNIGRLVMATSPTAIRTTAQYPRITSAVRRGNDYDVQQQLQTITHSSAWLANNWTGCIEERQTVATAADRPSISELERMHDLNIDLVPTADTRTQWLPAVGDPVITGAIDCPSRAVRLKAWTDNEMQTYVNALNPVGATYHDVGMVWGARLLSAGGIFSDSPMNFNGMRNFKFLVFLTDGQMAPEPTTYSAYGHEVTGRRVTGGSNPTTYRFFATADAMRGKGVSRHTGRFAELCRSVRAMPASVWAINISNDPTPNLEECAAVGQYAQVDSEAELRAKFSEIGQVITELRLSK